MRRLLPLLLLLAPSLWAQTQSDRISATQFSNRSIPLLVGTAPDVSKGNVFGTNSNGTITNFTGGVSSEHIWIICNDSATAIAPGTGILTGVGTLTCSPNTIFEFLNNGANSWLFVVGGGGGGGGGGTTTPSLPNNSVQFNSGPGAFTGDSHFLWTPSTGLTVTGGAGYTHSIASGTSNLNNLIITPSTVSLTAGQGTSNLNLQSSGTTQFTVGSANPFQLPTASVTTPGYALMTNGANPQLTSWSNNFTSGLQATLGTLTTDVNPFNLTFTYNNLSQVFNGVVWNATNTLYAPGSFDYQFCADTTKCFTINPLGAVQAANQVGAGDGSAAGNVQMLQGLPPIILANNAGIGAPTAVDAGGSYGTLPGSPCSGILSSFILSAPIYQIRCSNSTNNRQSNTAQTSTLTNVTLCSTADCPAGDYIIILRVGSNQTCATPGPASVSFNLTFTDTSSTKTNQPLPVTINGSITNSLSMSLGDVTHAGSAFYAINSNGTQPIVFSAPIVACTSGTAQYSYKIEAVRF